MLVIYRPESLSIEQCVHVHDPHYYTWLATQTHLAYVEVDGVTDVQGIALAMIDGEVQVVAKLPFPMAVPTAAVVGEEITILNVPEGTLIFGAGGALSMDSSGVLELQFDDPGRYRITFDHRLYTSQENSIEVVA